MTGVVRMALAYFSVVPLQRWISIFCLAMLALALAITPFAPGPGAMALTVLGSFIALIPLMMGGGLHRHASSRTLMHLRPHGRLRMLLAATVVVTMIAAIATVAVLVSHAVSANSAKAPFSHVSLFQAFAIAWSVTALMWAGTFITGASQVQGLLFGLLPLIAVKFGGVVSVVLPSPAAVLAAGIVAWLAFALWYMNVRTLRPMPVPEEMSVLHPENTMARLLARLQPRRGAVSSAAAINQYLFGSPSPARSAVVFGFGWVMMAAALLTVLVIFVLPDKGDAGLLMSQLIFLPVLMVSTASIAFGITRRSRLLWMRPGQDRELLFTRAERGGLAYTMPAIGIAAAVFVTFSLLNWPAHDTRILVFVGAQLLFALCLFYCGLSLTRGWASGDILLCAALCIFFVIEVVRLRPWNEQPSGAATLVGIMLVLAPVLRWHARRRWLAMDWRVARLLVARWPA
jgi:hypothetical protein